MQRDPKGIYKRALEGKVQQLINYPFDVPRPEERGNYINTIAQNTEDCYQSILEVVKVHLSDFAI
jgi:adenylylsulfate kinase-like enzyme